MRDGAAEVAARPPSALRRLDVAEGQAASERARPDRRGARGRRGDRRAGRGAAARRHRQIHRRRRAANRSRYWAMRYRDGDFVPNDEVDEIEWLRVGRAYQRLSYDIDRSVLADFAAIPVADSMVVLLRHAKAGKRTEWRGDDRLRPLDPSGERQATELAAAARAASRPRGSTPPTAPDASRPSSRSPPRSTCACGSSRHSRTRRTRTDRMGRRMRCWRWRSRAK